MPTTKTRTRRGNRQVNTRVSDEIAKKLDDLILFSRGSGANVLATGVSSLHKRLIDGDHSGLRNDFAENAR